MGSTSYTYHCHHIYAHINDKHQTVLLADVEREGGGGHQVSTHHREEAKVISISITLEIYIMMLYILTVFIRYAQCISTGLSSNFYVTW